MAASWTPKSGNGTPKIPMPSWQNASICSNMHSYKRTNKTSTQHPWLLTDIPRSKPQQDCCPTNATTIQRINQSYFRNSLLLNYQYTYCITGMQIPSMLIASHIKPWKASTPTEKTAASNGLLLNAFHDRAFDQGLISIDDDYRIMVNHDKVRHSPVNDQWLYAFEDQRITLPQSANLRMNLSRTTTNTYFSPKLHSHRDNPVPTHSTLPGDIKQIALRLFLPKHQSCPQVPLPA